MHYMPPRGQRKMLFCLWSHIPHSSTIPFLFLQDGHSKKHAGERLCPVYSKWPVVVIKKPVAGRASEELSVDGTLEPP